MKTYVFFDIECFDGAHGICEFGYVVINEAFKIIEKDNLLMDPECKMNLTGRPDQDDLHLTYSEKEYREHPKFTAYYGLIKKLLTEKDRTIIGYSLASDVNFLSKDCHVHGLEFFDFAGYDVQLIVPKVYSLPKRVISLDVATNTYVKEEDRVLLKDHRACDDAHATMLLLKIMCGSTGKSIEELFLAYPECRLDTKTYLEAQRARKKEKKALEKLKNRRIRNLEKWMALNQDAGSPNEAPSQRKAVSISCGIQEDNALTAKAIEIAMAQDWKTTRDLRGADILLTASEEESKSFLARFQNAQIQPVLIDLESFAAGKMQ